MKVKVLQYTWYPKDWQSSDIAYLIGPTERCTYREFIDLAMEHGNDVPDKLSLWWKKWNYDSLEHLSESVQKLVELGAILKTNTGFTVPSCNKRLERAGRNQENGRKGGRKPNSNPEETETEPRKNPELTEKEPKHNPEAKPNTIQYNTIQVKERAVKLCEFFKVTEQGNFRTYVILCNFIEWCMANDKLDYFYKQLDGYAALRPDPKYRSSALKFIGNPDISYEDGIWKEQEFIPSTEEKKLTVTEEMRKMLLP